MNLSLKFIGTCSYARVQCNQSNVLSKDPIFPKEKCEFYHHILMNFNKWWL